MNIRSNVRRIWHIFRVLIRHMPSYALVDYHPQQAWLARLLPDQTVPRPERLRMIFEDLGGTFIKFGQMLALGDVAEGYRPAFARVAGYIRHEPDRVADPGIDPHRTTETS